jgi:hypothetical protein
MIGFIDVLFLYLQGFIKDGSKVDGESAYQRLHATPSK